MIPKTRRSTVICGATITLAAGAIVLPLMLDLDSFRPVILSAAKKTLDRPVDYKSLAISWEGSPCVVFRNLSLGDGSGDAELLNLERLKIRVALLPLLRKEIVVREVVVEQPLVTLKRDHAGDLNFEQKFGHLLSGFRVHLDSVRIVKGTVRFTDFHVGEQRGILTTLENLDLAVSGLERGETCSLRLSATMPDERGSAALTVSGNVKVPGRQESLLDARLDVRLSAKNVDPGRFWPYFGGNLPCEPVHGRVDIQEVVTGALMDFSAKGSLTGRNIRISYPRFFTNPLRLRNFHLVHDVQRAHGAIAVKSFKLELDQLQLNGSCSLGDIASNDPHVTARVSSAPFRLEHVRRYIPDRAVPDGVPAIIDKHVAGGTYQLDEARLDGRISQIVRMEPGHDDRVLSVRAHVEDGLVTLGQDVPTANRINGSLVINGKDLIAKGVTGNIGGSPFALEGKIQHSPLSFPFSVSVSPAQGDLAWLLRLKNLPPNTMSAGSVLYVTGSGTLDAYCLAGSWSLPDGDSRRQGPVIKQPAANRGGAFPCRPDTLPHPEEESGLHFAARASYRPDRHPPLMFSGISNDIALESLPPVFPVLSGYAPKGRVRASMHGSGDPSTMDGFRLAGEVALTGVTVQPLRQFEPISNVSGMLRLAENASVEVDRLMGNFGNSAFTLKGRLTTPPDPGAELEFSFPSLRVADLGFVAQGEVPDVSSFGGRISLVDGILAIKEWSGQIGSSEFRVNGEVADIGAPEVRLAVDFPKLRVEDLLPFAAMKPPELPAAESEGSHGMSLQAKVTSGKGTVRDTPFRDLNAQVFMRHGHLDVKAFDVEAFGGTVSGKGEASLSGNAGPAFRAQYRLNHVATGDLHRLAGMERRLTGWMTAEGELAAHGRTLEEVRNSAEADAKIVLSDGLVHIPARHGMKAMDLPFKGIRTEVGYARKLLDIKSVSIDAFDGAISGKGQADLNDIADPVYSLRCTLANVDTGALSEAAGRAHDVSGLLNLQTEVTARGDVEASLKKTLEGSLRIHMEKGSINRFGLLSKVFSILNFSELLEYRLPDLLSEGMLYDRIAGDLSFKGGKAYAKELSLASPSVNITAEGSADLVTSQLDMKIGVEAFQTVGKVVSKVPIAGWLLTDRNNRMLVSYFEAKGKWDDPKVSVLAKDSMSNGALPILRKTLALPQKIVTEPEAVIMGK